MQVMVWFYTHVDTLGRLMKIVITEQRREEGEEVDDDEEEEVIMACLLDSSTHVIGYIYLEISICFVSIKNFLAPRFSKSF